MRAWDTRRFLIHTFTFLSARIFLSRSKSSNQTTPLIGLFLYAGKMDAPTSC
jgi:hypothetical protein